MTEFFKTRMGQKFYTSDVPRITEALERIATVLEKAPEDPLKTPKVIKDLGKPCSFCGELIKEEVQFCSKIKGFCHIKEN